MFLSFSLMWLVSFSDAEGWSCLSFLEDTRNLKDVRKEVDDITSYMDYRADIVSLKNV